MVGVGNGRSFFFFFSPTYCVLPGGVADWDTWLWFFRPTLLSTLRSVGCLLGGGGLFLMSINRPFFSPLSLFLCLGLPP